MERGVVGVVCFGGAAGGAGILVARGIFLSAEELGAENA